MKKIFFIAMMFICTIANAQEWTDVTKYFFNNPNFKDGTMDDWEYNVKPNSKTDGAVLYNGSNRVYLYNSASGLTKGHYRLTVYGFYRDGSAASDWSKYKSANYTGNSNAIYYFGLSGKYYQYNLPCASSGALDEPLDSNATKVGTGKYIPSTVASAAKWFKAGYYAKSYEFDSDNNGFCYAEPYIQTSDGNGVFVFGGVKLEYKGKVNLHENIIIDYDTLVLAKGIRSYITYTTVPKDVTVVRYEYTSSNPGVATVDWDGQITGVSVGETVITMKAVDGSNVSASFVVAVKTPDVAKKDNVKLSEVLVINNNWFLDESSNYGSLIELYNPSANYVSLSGLYLTDDKTNLKKARVNLENSYKQTTNLISPYSFRYVGFDHYDAVFAPEMIDFKLKYDGGTIYVTDGLEIIDSVTYPKAITNVSYVKNLKTDEWSLCTHPSLGYYFDNTDYPNLFGSEQAPVPSFSEKGGFFTGKKIVTLNVPEGTIVRLTSDGTMPTRNHGEIYTQDTELEFSASKPFRAMAYKSGYLNSDVVTTTFIKKDKRYVFPSINIVTDPDNLNDNYMGIFVSGYGMGRPGNGKDYSCNWNADWDRPANFEFINEDGDYVFSQNVDISACGGWSRAWTPHSFKVKANKFYSGQSSMNFQFFKDKPYIHNKVLQVRNGGNDNTYRFKDPALQEIVRRSGINVNTQCWQPVHVFVNGVYNTVLNMREPNNKHYAYSNYGYDTDEVDQFEMSPDSGYVQKAGTPDKFKEWYELTSNASDPVVYESIGQIVDIDEFINYMAVQLFLANNDWPENNVKAFRSQNDGKFHFVLFDLDQANQVSSSPFLAFEKKKTHKFNSLCGDSRTPWKSGDRITKEIELVTIFLNMLENDSFRKQFVDTYCIVAGSVFAQKNVTKIVDDMRTYMNKGMALSGETCNGTYNSIRNLYTDAKATTMIGYLKSYSRMKIKKSISAKISVNIPEAELFVNNVKVPYGSLVGTLFDDVTLSTCAPEGYKFLGWSFIADDTIKNLSFKVEKTSVRCTANWAKLTDEEMLAKNYLSKPVVINEVSASNDVYVSDYFKKADWFELYNNTDEEVNIAGLYLSDNIDKPYKYQVPVDDEKLNTVIPARGYKVIWCDKKDNIGSAIHSNFKLEGDSGIVMITKTDDDNLVYSDTLSYVSHSGTESFGRYPDGGISLCKMNKMTPGAKNIRQGDVLTYMTKLVTSIDNVVDSNTESGIIISYVGDGVVNIKSDNVLKNVVIVSTSGTVVYEEELNSTFKTISLSSSRKGMYIIKVVDNCSNSASHKITLK